MDRENRKIVSCWIKKLKYKLTAICEKKRLICQRLPINQWLICIPFFAAVSVRNLLSVDHSTRKQVVVLDSRLSYNGREVPGVKRKIYVFDNYLFEPANTVIIYSNGLVGKGGHVVSDPVIPDTFRDSLMCYTLIDIKLLHCNEFSLSDPPEVTKTYPVSEKKKGLRFSIPNHEMVQNIKDEAQHFYVTGDTLINNCRYRVLEGTGQVVMDNFKYHKVRFFLNQDVADFPFHPSSTTLDLRFKGICTGAVFYDRNGNAMKMEWPSKKQTIRH